jgi:hypothetical protein
LTLRRSVLLWGLHPYPQTVAPVAQTSGTWCLRDSRSFRSPLRSALRAVRGFQGSGAALPGSASATTASADFSLRPTAASPFQARGEISPGKGRGLRCTVAGSTPLVFGRKDFAIPSSLVLTRRAFYPVSVRRHAVSAPRFFQRRPRGRDHFALRFARGPCDQVPQRTCTSWSRPCWAHIG